MKRLIIIFLLLSSWPVFAQSIQCSDRLPTDNSNACANTRFVQGTIAGETPDSKVYYVLPTGNNANSGLAWASAKLTIQAAIDAAATAGEVIIGPGTYTLSATLNARPGITLRCIPGAIITQANSANLNPLIAFDALAADNGGLEDCDLRGNRANNTNGDIPGIRIGSANNVTVRNNKISGFTGHAVYVTSGTTSTITYNIISDFTGFGIYINGSSTDNSATICFNRLSTIGQGGISTINTNKNLICNNKLVGNRTAAMVVNVNGTAVARVSGANFSTVKAGQFLIFNGGTEAQIASVTDNNNVVLGSSGGVHAGVAAVAGPGDLIGSCNTSDVQIIGNELSGGAVIGVSLCNLASATSTKSYLVSNNIILDLGAACFSIQNDGSSNTISGVSVTSNILKNCGQSSTAGASLTGFFISQGTDNITAISLIGNNITDTSSLMTSWLECPTATVGTIAVRGNQVVGAPLSITGGLGTFILGVGWGASGAVTGTTKFSGDTILFQITPNGAGLAAFSATVEIPTRVTKASFPVLWTCVIIGGSSSVTDVLGDQNLASSIAIYGAYYTLPVAGQTYNIQCN